MKVLLFGIVEPRDHCARFAWTLLHLTMSPSHKGRAVATVEGPIRGICAGMGSSSQGGNGGLLIWTRLQNGKIQVA